MIDVRKIDGTRIACRVNDGGLRDDRKTVVFIHGSGGDHTLWEHQFAALDGFFNVVGVDLPGHGGSEGTGERDVESYVEWVKKIIEALGVRRPVLAGHSLGAAISLTFAVNYGGLLSGIIPVGGGVTMPVNEAILNGIRNDLAATLAFVAKFSVAKQNRERLAKAIIEGMIKVNSEVIYGDFLSCDRLNITEDIKSINIPTLLICGEEDKMTPPALSEHMARTIPGAELSVIEAAGHFVMQENPSAFNGVIKDFIEHLRG